MPEKPKKARSWKSSHTAIAIVAMLTQVALCNAFAGVDRQRLNTKASPTELLPAASPTVIAAPVLADACPVIVPKKNMGAKCIARTRSS